MTLRRYDDLNRLLEVESVAEGEIARLQYDAAGNVTRVTDPKNQQTNYVYDALSRVAIETRPLGQVLAYAYDGRGRLAQVTNARGNVLRYGYFGWGGLEKVEEYLTAISTPASKTVSYTYGDTGRITTVSDSTAPNGPLLYTYAYDARDRVDTTTTHYLPGGSRVLDSDYDRFGNRKQLALIEGAETLVQGWTYNKLDRMASAALAGGTTSYGYRANDELETITRASGVQTQYGYFAHGPIQSVTTYNAASSLLHRLAYTVDGTLNVDTATETRGAGSPQLFDYGYDGLDRLTSAVNPTAYGLPASEPYDYDLASNRETPGSAAAYDYDANNRIGEPGGDVDLRRGRECQREERGACDRGAVHVRQDEPARGVGDGAGRQPDRNGGVRL